jgi:hypothetical protein
MVRRALFVVALLALIAPLIAGCNPEQNLIRLQFGRTAIVTGDFDTVEVLIQEIANSTPVEAEIHYYNGYVDGPHFETEVGAGPEDLPLQVEDLLRAETASALDQFQTVFLSCGMRGVSDHVYNGVGEDNHLVEDETVIQHLRDTASNGTSLYFSDWTYDFIERAWPEKVAWVGDQEELDIAQAGRNGPVNARIVDPALADFMEVPVGSELEIEFNQSGWAVPGAVADDVTVLVAADVDYDDPYTGVWTTLQDVPLVFTFDAGAPVVYTAFHNEAQITDDARDVLRFALTRLSDS